MGTHLRVLSETYPMNTNMTGFRCFSNIFSILNEGGGGCPFACALKFHQFNPLILTAAKSSLTIFDEIFEAKVKLEKYLKGQHQSEYHQQLSFKYIVKLFSIPKLWSKVV